jgi:hypothetical protein
MQYLERVGVTKWCGKGNTKHFGTTEMDGNLIHAVLYCPDVSVVATEKVDNQAKHQHDQLTSEFV